MNFQKLNLASIVGTIIFKGRPLQGEHQDVTSQGDNGKASIPMGTAPTVISKQ